MKLIKGFIFLVLLTFIATSGYATPVQWKVADGGNGHWYDFGYDSSRTKAGCKSWAESLTYNGQAGYLVTITSDDEQAFIYTNILIPNPGRYYTGGKRWDEGDGVTPLGWSWDHGNGDAWGYTNWGSGQPSTASANDDLEIQADGTWRAIDGYITHSGGIVEFDAAPQTSAVPEPATMLLLGPGLIGLAVLTRKKRLNKNS